MNKILESSYEEYLKNDPRGLKFSDGYDKYGCFFCKKKIKDCREAVWCKVQCIIFNDIFLLCSEDCRNLWILNRTIK